jgi:hypothetical protein
MIKRDLEFARTCFDQIKTNEHGVGFGMPDFNSAKKDTVDWCIFVTGAIYYRRCFKSGVRTWLLRHEIADILGDELLDLHDALIDITDKYVAHSVNEMELGCTTIDISIDEKGHVDRGGIGWRGAGIGALSPAHYHMLTQIISLIADGPLAEKIAGLTKLVNIKVQRMTDDEIMQLPDGFAPLIDVPKYDRRRTWPPRSE